MTFVPALPLTGYAGWKFLGRTREAQQAALSASPVMKTNAQYFRENIGKVRTGEDLVADRRLMTVALGAFGLDDDINSKFFIRKVLESSTFDAKSLANKLSDKRYVEMAKAFGFGDFPTSPNTLLSTFPDKIVKQFEARQFERAVGEQNQPMRLAMNAERELAAIADKKGSENTKWFTIMGNAPLRQVMETAFGLPKQFGSADLDQQLGEFKKRAQQFLGSSDPAMFKDPAKVEELVKLFLVRSDIAAGPSGMTRGSAALSILQNSPVFF